MTPQPSDLQTLSREIPGTLHFLEGLAGFENFTEYELKALEGTPFYSMVSKENEEIGFILTLPWHFVQHYEADIPDEICQSLGIQSPEEAELLALVTVREPIEQSTMNLAAPLLIQHRTKNALQVILNDPKWSTRTYLTQEVGFNAGPEQKA